MMTETSRGISSLDVQFLFWPSLTIFFICCNLELQIFPSFIEYRILFILFFIFCFLTVLTKRMDKNALNS